MTIEINGIEKTVEILPMTNETLDETLDTFSCTLIIEDAPMPFAPMQSLKVIMGNGEELLFVIVSDSVELASFKPEKYKHTITATQNTRELSKHMVRNSVFTQPARKYKTSHNAFSRGIGESFRDEDNNLYGNLEPTSYTLSNNGGKIELRLDKNEKVSRAYIQLELHVVFSRATYTSTGEWINNIVHQSELENLYTKGELTFDNGFYIAYKVRNQAGITKLGIDATDLGGEILFNTKMECQSLMEIFQNNDIEYIYLEYSPTDGFFTGKMYPSLSDNIAFFSIDAKIVAETYYYTAYDILDLLIKRQQQITNQHSKAPLFSLPTQSSNPELYNLLKTTIAPNFIFTQNTMYECVADVFRLFDAIFTMNENGELGIEYFNDRNGTVITPTFVGKNLTLGEEKYTNGLVAYYQDARTEEFFPSKTGLAPVRSQELGVPIEADHHFLTPHNIQAINECRTLITQCVVSNGYPNGSVSNQITVSGDLELDITDYVVEQSLWTLLDSTANTQDGEPNTIVQNNTVYFAEGDNKIQLAYSYKNSWGVQKLAYYSMISCAFWKMLGLWYLNSTYFYILKPSNNFTGTYWNDVRLRVNYITSVDGRTQIETITDKYEGETLIDQYNGAVDLNKMGLNMLGLSLKLGEPTLNATLKITTWANRIKKGSIYKYLGYEWIVNDCSYTLLGDDYIQEKISLIKNFNALALRTRLLKERRVSNISSQLTIKSEDNYIEYVYYSSIEPEETSETICFDTTHIYEGMHITFNGNTTDNINVMNGAIQKDGTLIYMPTIKYGLGNMLCFEMSYSNPMNAGNQTTYTTATTWFGTNKYYTKAIKYTDDIGFMDEATIYILANLVNQSFNNNFPEIGTYTPVLGGNASLKIDTLKVYKQPNEIFALNYELAFIPFDQEKDFLHPKFINENFLVSNERIARKLYLYRRTDGTKFSILDTKAEGTRTPITSTSRLNNRIIFNFNEVDGNYPWCIADENGDILFSSNRIEDANITSKRIYFITKHDRI